MKKQNMQMTKHFQAAEEPGYLLRDLRQMRKIDGKKLTITDLAIHSGVSRTIISGLENKSLNADRRRTLKISTVTRLLEALSDIKPVPYSDWNAVLHAFGFNTDNSLPTEVDIQRAVQEWTSKKQGSNPVYLSDFAFRIHDWNDLIPQFLGLPHGSDALKSVTIIDLVFGEEFNPEVPSIVILNREEYLTVWFEDIKTELSRFEQEAWHHEFVVHNSQKYPAFKHLWESVPCKKVYVWEPKLLPAVQISINGSEPLKFRIEGPELSTDPRFRVIEYKPWDAETSMKCFALLAEANSGHREL